MLIVALSAFYVTYLMVEAVIFDTPRSWLAGRSYWLGELLGCEKCSAFWAALFSAVLYWAFPAACEVFAAAGAVLLIWRLWQLMEKSNADTESTDI